MIPCDQCSRHFRSDELACPFCAAQRPGTIAAAALFLLLGVAACGSAVSDSGGDSTTTGTDSAPTTSSSGPTTTSTSTVDTGTTTGTDTGTVSVTSDGNDDVNDSGCAFYGCPGDSGPLVFECDLFAQDCPAGEKCMPWANDNGNVWNATRCSPIDPEPADVGEGCIAEGSGTSGIDNCGPAAMCWEVDPDTNVGTCVALCTGSPAQPLCEDPQTECWGGAKVLALCLPTCNPIAPQCGVDEACLPADEGFLCLGDGLQGEAAQGEACDYPYACAAGLRCVDAEFVEGCVGPGCCTAYCDLEDAGADATCAAAAAGSECIAIYDPGQAPAGLDSVGACTIPA